MARRKVMSDSEESDIEAKTPSVPRDAELEKALRDTVAEVYEAGNLDQLTVRRVRTAAEKRLGLGEGFFKGDSRWKEKSEEVIKHEVEVQDTGASHEKPENSSEEQPPSPHKTKSIEPRIPKAKAAKRARPTDTSKPRKRPKKTSLLHSEPESESPELSELSVHDSDDEDEEVRRPAKSRTNPSIEKTAHVKPADSEPDSPDAQDDTPDARPSTGKDDSRADSESEMSVVLDETPKPSHRRQKSGQGASTRKGGKKAASKSTDVDLDPDKEEIKRLQGWLVKCGIRKMWFRELAPYPTPKAKIKHLKDMLKEAGMGGRYSLEKARQIREERELKADLEMVQEGAKRWGTGSADEGSDGGKPRRRLNRGMKSLAFLDSDGEETD